MQPVNLLLGVFSRAEQRVLQSIFKETAVGGGRCVATLETLARNSNTSKSSAQHDRRAVKWPARKTERRYCSSVSFPTFWLGQLWRRVLRQDLYRRPCRSAKMC
jgi:hypothetical protein